LANAVTRASQDITDYDQATELEKLGGKVIELRGTECLGKTSSDYTMEQNAICR
jgi:hypothetical protein